MDKNEGLVIIKSASDLFYIRHLDSRGEIRFSEINKNKNPSLIDLLNQTTAPKTLQMSQLLLAIADKAGQLPHKSQYFGNVQSMVGLIFRGVAVIGIILRMKWINFMIFLIVFRKCI